MKRDTKRSSKPIKKLTVRKLSWLKSLAVKLYSAVKLRFFTQEPSQALPLLPLLPQPGKPENSYYSDQLEDALKNKNLLNIALTGSYGSGKSSIILSLKNIDKRKVLQISFSSLGANIQGLIQAGQSEEHSKLVDIANLIQKEILKQILFREQKHRLPNSQFLRIAKPIKRYHFIASLILATIFLTALIVVGIIPKLLSTLGISDNFISILLISDIYAAIMASIWLFFLLAARSFKVDKIGTSAVALSLNSSDESSYFDKYLVEILYFFESTKYDIVVFEDIDRFENLYIFENLRQLNTILNTTQQIKRKIRFIYAVKDSIFTKSVHDRSNPVLRPTEESDTDEEKTEPRNIDFSLNDENVYNRTKFFDLIISVVPFITSSSSSEYLLGFFDKKDREKLRGPVQTASKYISDMRLVKNLHNEYLIFKKMILTPKSGLDEAKLYAMVIYKNINLEDFELIPAGKSKLNKVMSEFNEFITRKSVDTAAEVVELRKRLNSLNSLSDRATSLGGLLRSDITRYLSQLGGTLSSITLSETVWDEGDLSTLAFWEQVIDSDTPELKVRFVSSVTRALETITYTLADMQKVTSSSLSRDEWKEVDTKEIQSRITALDSSLKQLRIMTLQSAISRYPNEIGKTLKNLLVDDDITWDLVQAGHIDNDFTNYTSIYNDSSVSLEARAFILQNINHDSPSPGHKFKNSDDIENMLEQVGNQGLRSRGIFNIEVLDHLLSNRLDKRAYYVFNGFDPKDSSELAFIDLYLKDGKYPKEFIRQLVSRWKDVLIYISESKTLFDSDKAKYLDIAIGAASMEERYPPSEYISNLLNTRPEYFNTLSNIKNEDRINDFLTRIAGYNIEFKNISKLSDIAQKSVIEKGMYEVNVDNMKLLTTISTPSLTKLREDYDNVYNKVIAKLDDYSNIFDSLPEDIHTINSNAGLEVILNDVAKSDSATISKIINRIDANTCSVHDIEKVPTSLWKLLLRLNIPDNTASNLIAYFKYSSSETEESGTLTDEIIKYINHNLPIVMDKEPNEFDEEQLEAFAIAILNSTAFTIPDKISIVETIYPELYLEVDKIIFTDSSLAGELIKAEIINDNLNNYTYIRDNYPDSIKNWILQSNEFNSYIASIPLNEEEIDIIATSDVIPSGLKNYLINSLTQLAPNMSNRNKQQLTKLAADLGAALEFSELELLIPHGNWFNFSKLIVNSHDKLTNTQIRNLLSKMGGEFSKLLQTAKPAKFAKLSEHISLLEDLKTRGFVSSISVKQKEVIAYMKKKQPS
jgi:hypothetical protein